MAIYLFLPVLKFKFKSIKPKNNIFFNSFDVSGFWVADRQQIFLNQHYFHKNFLFNF